jgi:hypothetical protein
MDRWLKDPNRIMLSLWDNIKDFSCTKSIDMLSTVKNRLAFYITANVSPVLPQPPIATSRVHPIHPVGVIHGSQEPGLKLRAFASPKPALQASLEGLKTKLMKVLRSLPWDCCHDQDKGVRRVQTWIQSGRSLYSVDLSDATNNAPLLMQEDLLLYLGVPGDEVYLFSSISHSFWENPWPGEDKSGEVYPPLIKWNIGQPLGTGPSFASFSLFHAWLVLAAMAKVGKPISSCEDVFVILGDDIVISDAAVHTAYREILDLLMLPVSPSKCLESTTAAEFAGVLITSKYTYRGFKFTQMNPKNYLSVIGNAGLGALNRSYLTPYQYNTAKFLRDLPPPWGFGFNSKGVPHEVQLNLLSFLVMWHYKKDLVASSLPLLSAATAVARVLYRYGIRFDSRPADWFRRIHPILEGPSTRRKKTFYPQYDEHVARAELAKIIHDPKVC